MPGHRDVVKLVELTEEHFPRKKNKKTWLKCMMDKRENNDLLVDFVFIHYLPNCSIVDNQKSVANFELAIVIFVVLFLNS